MDFTWVRSQQTGGGKSRWHLLVDRRRGRIFRGQPTVDFALTACGEAFGPEIEVAPGRQVDPWNAGIAIPALVRNPNTQCCETCRQTAWRLLNSAVI